MYTAIERQRERKRESEGRERERESERDHFSGERGEKAEHEGSFPVAVASRHPFA